MPIAGAPDRLGRRATDPLDHPAGPVPLEQTVNESLHNMEYQTGEYEATHREAIWRDRSNFIFAAHLGVKEGKNEWEQLWGQKTGPQRFILCCVPFFVRDLALGDEVETNADFVLTRVIQPSGQVTFRVWFGGQQPETRESIAREISEFTPLMEWSSESLLALSAPDAAVAAKLADYLRIKEHEGQLKYETGRS